MQTQKDYTRESILRAAEEIFLRDGFQKANMRDIAQRAQVGLGNVYNYFRSKDELLRVLVAPAVQELNRVMMEHHSQENVCQFMDYLDGHEKYLLEEQVKGYTRLAQYYRRPLELLLTKAQGSSMENFADEYTDRCTEQVSRYMEEAARLRPEISGCCHPFTYHLHTVWMFQLLSEIVKHRLRARDVAGVVRDYITFEYNGWRGLMKT